VKFTAVAARERKYMSASAIVKAKADIVSASNFIQPREYQTLGKFIAVSRSVDKPFSKLLKLGIEVRAIFAKVPRGIPVRYDEQTYKGFDDFVERSMPVSGRTMRRWLAKEGKTEKKFANKSKPVPALPAALGEIKREKEATIRKAAQIPADKPVTKSHIKAYDKGWYEGASANIHRVKNNRALDEKHHGDKNREKAVKAALGIALNAAVEKDKMAVCLNVYRAGYDAGYNAGFVEGQEQQMQYDLDNPPSEDKP
jgi:hypothetical protein